MTAQSHTFPAIVVKVGGAALESPTRCDALWAAFARIHATGNPRVIIVHGGGAAVDRRLAALGLASERREGIRITPPEHINHVVEVLAGSTNLALVAALQRHGARAVGLRLADGHTVRAAKTTRYSFDPGCVGEIIGGDPSLLHTLLNAGVMPVVSSIALDDAGGPLNINADDAAAGLAAIIDARELILLTDVHGVKDAVGDTIADLNASEIARLIDDGVIHGGMIVKVRAAAEAAERSGRPVIIASWDRPEDLDRIAAGQTAGTRIHPPTSASNPSSHTPPRPSANLPQPHSATSSANRA
jgi:acetylglutamate kinase